MIAGGSLREFDEGNPREPPHIHAVLGEKTAKFWLEPVELANSKRLSAPEITTLHRIVTRLKDAHFDA
jgi:hypothetical protein